MAFSGILTTITILTIVTTIICLTIITIIGSKYPEMGYKRAQGLSKLSSNFQ